jgi:uncharacterized protein (TIRG00374 family)
MSASRTVFKLAVKILVSAGLLVFLLSKISVDDLLALAKGLDRRMITGAMLVFFVSNVLGSLQWHLLLTKAGVEISFPRSLRFYFVGLFFNNFLPANIGGDAVKIYDVSRIASDVYQVTAVTLLDRLIGIFGLCLLAVAAVLSGAEFLSGGSIALYLFIFLGCMAPLVGFYFFAPLGKLLRRLVGLIRPLSMDQRVSRILDHLSGFKARRMFVLRLALLSLLIQFLRVVTHILAAQALGVAIDEVIFGLFFVFVPLLSLAMVPPVTVNGLGVREGLGILLFARAGIGQTDAFATEFLTYLVSVSVSLLGLVFFMARRGAATQARPDASTI